jgi:hypothetical protein
MTVLQQFHDDAITPGGTLRRHLIAETKRLVGCERAATAALLQSLMEIDTRRLYLREGCSSLFTYCTQVPCELYSAFDLFRTKFLARSQQPGWGRPWASAEPSVAFNRRAKGGRLRSRASARSSRRNTEWPRCFTW